MVNTTVNAVATLEIDGLRNQDYEGTKEIQKLTKKYYELTNNHKYVTSNSVFECKYVPAIHVF
jgi:hypothetical protein